jgi:hypothetical protein
MARFGFKGEKRRALSEQLEGYSPIAVTGWYYSSYKQNSSLFEDSVFGILLGRPPPPKNGFSLRNDSAK